MADVSTPAGRISTPRAREVNINPGRADSQASDTICTTGRSSSPDAHTRDRETSRPRWTAATSSPLSRREWGVQVGQSARGFETLYGEHLAAEDGSAGSTLVQLRRLSDTMGS